MQNFNFFSDFITDFKRCTYVEHQNHANEDEI